MIRELHLSPLWACSITASYVVFGLFGLLLFAQPPNYATTVFIPAGLAVLSTFLFGLWALPSIFIGSSILNCVVAFLPTYQLCLAAFEAALAIAAASSLQAACGSHLFRRFMRFHDFRLINYQNLATFTALIPAVCLISASLSIFALWWLDRLPVDQLLSNWLSWYIGDAFGMLVMLPWMLLLYPLNEQEARWAQDVLKGKIR